MAEGVGHAPVAVTAAATAEEMTARELAASRHELVDAVVRQIDFSVTQMKSTPDEARERFRRCLHDDPASVRSDQITWVDLSALAQHDPDRGHALWQRLKDEATEALATASRAGRNLERPNASSPGDRAAYIAIVAGLRQALTPRDPLEEMLVQQMASAYELHLRWQTILVRRMEEEIWQGERDQRRALANLSPAQRETYQTDHGWIPPRLGQAEAEEQAAVLADRYQRAFLRLMKAYRDNRRLFSALVVAGGQVNIADGPQQVNVHQEPAQRPAPTRTAQIRRTAPARMRRSGTTS
jgi:hypothetical protein